MAVAMIGPKFYAWNRNGKPLAFGKLYTYQARTNTPKPTYQSEDQVVENTNPVILNGEGYANVYLDGSYKMVLKDDKDNEIWSSDPVSSAQPDEWVACFNATYISPTSFKVAGNQTDFYTEERKVRINNGTSEYSYSTIKSSIYAGGETSIELYDSVVTTGIIDVCASITSPNSGFNNDDVGQTTNFVADGVPNMLQGVCLSGVAVELKAGQVWSSGGTKWRLASISEPVEISDFKPIGYVDLDDFKEEEVSQIVSNLFSLEYKILANGEYKCSNVEIPDHYVELVGGGEFNSESEPRVLFQQRMAENSVTLQSNINKGNTTCVLSDAGIPVGAIVRLVSNKMISRLWTQSVVRPYYQEGEINKVISKNGNTYTFETEFFFDYDQADMQEASWYTPREGMKIEAKLINDASAVFSGNTGLEIWQQDDNVELSIKTERFNSQGVLLGQCWKPNVSRVGSIGGDDASGLNYALNVADGTRFAAIGLVRGEDTRHSITIGGSGRAISLQGNVTKAFNTNTNKTSVALPGIDMHGNSGGFIFNECITDTTVTIGGVNNHINTAICGDGWFTIAGEDGGFNCSIGTIKMTNPYRITNSSYPVLGLHIDHFNVEYTKVVAQSEFNLNSNGTTTIGRLVVKNRGVDEAGGINDATAKAQPNPWAFRSNTDIDNAFISGFSYVRFVGDDINVKKLTIDNVCWETSVNAGSAIYFQTDSERINIGQIVSKSSNANLTYTERMIGFESASNFNEITIENVSGFSGRPRVIDVPATVTKLRLLNNTVTGISSSVSPDQRVWGWEGLADV